MEAAILLVLLVIGGLQVAALVAASRGRALSSRAFTYRKSHDARFARLVAVLRDRTEDLKHALSTCQIDNSNLTQLVHSRDAEISRLTTLISALPFLQEQTKHLQLVLVEQVKEANSRVLALADSRVQAQFEGQLLTREGIAARSYQDAQVEAARSMPPGAPDIELRRRAQQIVDERAQQDGYRNYPVDAVPVDAINYNPEPDADYRPRRGESTVVRPEKISDRHSPYDAEQELADAMANVGMTPDRLNALVDQITEQARDNDR